MCVCVCLQCGVFVTFSGEDDAPHTPGARWPTSPNMLKHGMHCEPHSLLCRQMLVCKLEMIARVIHEHLALRPAIEHLAMVQCLAANDRGAASDPREVLLCGAFVTLSVQPVCHRCDVLWG